MAELTDDTVLEAGARRSLIRLAYRLLGSVEEAEDVVQDAHLTLLRATPSPDNAHACLFRVVTNLAIDRLRHLQVQRRAYPGPWLPEPLVTGSGDGLDTVERRDDLGVAFLLLLERLTVSERVAFVLREAFDLSFQEMGGILEVRVEACRQRYHRARRKLEGAQRPAAPPARQRRVLDRLIDAVSAGDSKRLASLLTDDALLLTDGGGRASAAIRPVEGADRIARVLVHLAQRDDMLGYGVRTLGLNHAPALLITVEGADGAAARHSTVQIDLDGERVSRIYIVRNPEKLRGLP